LSTVRSLEVREDGGFRGGSSLLLNGSRLGFRVGSFLFFFATLKVIAMTLPLTMVFDSIELKRIPVTIGGVEYVLQEADSEAGALYEDTMIASVKMEDSKPVSVSNVKKRDLDLLVSCLRIEEKTDKGVKERRVLRSFVMELPRKVTAPLIDAVKEMSGIETTGEELGESPEDTGDNSD
tara:strand:+ start:1260 stop:1796 length:537 start_codon:yes stop_codon:yes gene_type:complete